MKKGVADIVQRLTVWGDDPDYEIKSISKSNDGKFISIVIEGEKNECAECKCNDSENQQFK